MFMNLKKSMTDPVKDAKGALIVEVVSLVMFIGKDVMGLGLSLEKNLVLIAKVFMVIVNAERVWVFTSMGCC
jgi:hypothetical protein